MINPEDDFFPDGIEEEETNLEPYEKGDLDIEDIYGEDYDDDNFDDDDLDEEEDEEDI